MIKEWKKNFTSDKQYLLDTQNVIKETSIELKHKTEDEKITSIWKELKTNEDFFLEKYCYIEWDFLKILNRSSSFLQIMSIVNMMSPVLSLMLPILFLIIPFIILKLRNIPITVFGYLNVLKEKNIEVIWQIPRLPETNMLDLGVWMSIQSVVQRVHFNRRCHHDALATSTVQKLV